MMNWRNWIISLMMLGCAATATAQQEPAAHRDSMRLLSRVMLPDCLKNSWHETDSIRNAAQLERFFDGLIALRQGKDTVLTVVQLGDSHIQAGYLPGRIMRLLHADFGNAGRGWLSPLKLSKTNEPADYFITSNISEWTAGRCIQNNKKCQIGIGGMAIQAAPTPRINLNLIITPNNGAGYGFNQAVFYRDAAAMPMKPVEQQWGLVDWQTSDSILIGGVVADTFRMQAPIDTLRLTSMRKKPGSIESAPASAFTNRYYGFNLTNGDPGILYHAVGINGAMYENYTDSLYLQQLALLSPDLLILSLGTNETFGRRFRGEEFEAQVRALLQMIRRYLPETALLLTTPPECYKRVTVDKKRTYVRNQHTQTAAQVITAVADELQLPCWDLFATGGGKGSCATWHQQGLMGRDRIHFNQNGYLEQGTLFYRALMQSYNQYNTQRDVY